MPIARGKSPAKSGLNRLLGELRGLIRQARQQALRSVDWAQVETCWQVGRHLIEFEQEGNARAKYGTGLLARVAAALTADFGPGYDASNLRNMRLFYQAFPNCDTLRHELSRSHYRLLMRVEDSQARLWYVQEAAGQNWSTRQLERQIGTLYNGRDHSLCKQG